MAGSPSLFVKGFEISIHPRNRSSIMIKAHRDGLNDADMEYCKKASSNSFMVDYGRYGRFDFISDPRLYLSDNIRSDFISIATRLQSLKKDWNMHIDQITKYYDKHIGENLYEKKLLYFRAKQKEHELDLSLPCSESLKRKQLLQNLNPISGIRCSSNGEITAFQRISKTCQPLHNHLELVNVKGEYSKILDCVPIGIPHLFFGQARSIWQDTVELMDNINYMNSQYIMETLERKDPLLHRELQEYNIKPRFA